MLPDYLLCLYTDNKIKRWMKRFLPPEIHPPFTAPSSGAPYIEIRILSKKQVYAVRLGVGSR